jgi:hypothetical protein
VHWIYYKRRFPPQSDFLFTDSLSFSRHGVTSSLYSYAICGTLVHKNDSLRMYEKISMDELMNVLYSFKKYKSPGPDEWLSEFYLGFIDLL